MTPELNRIYLGDCVATMKTWPDAFVHTVVTSPPYWGLRDYGVKGQIGLEETFDEFLEKMVAVFREVRRVLRPDGTIWVNMGDSYNAYNGNRGKSAGINKNPQEAMPRLAGGHGLTAKNLKPKDLVGQPWMLAFALRADGWYLRQDIIWAKTNPMPESVSDRCTKAHEYVFLLTKSPRYYFDAEAIKEPSSMLTNSRGNGVNPKCAGWADGPGSHAAVDHAKSKKDAGSKFGQPSRGRVKQNESFAEATKGHVDNRNKRSVWTINTEPFSEAHFATYPTALVAPCILAGSPRGGVVLDPFMGAGTTALTATRHSRHFIGCELSQKYLAIANKRVANELAQGKFL